MDNLRLNAIKDEFEELLDGVERLKRIRMLDDDGYDYLRGPLGRIEKLLKGE